MYEKNTPIILTLHKGIQIRKVLDAFIISDKIPRHSELKTQGNESERQPFPSSFLRRLRVEG